ncbi:PREDICTED: putative E3 ubiquitin-protein ligase UBR7 [Camelina sativa]|uniref:E3 ubiquitin-protein ligase UBR7 n=1 Tax=Camelina sativa TaxID=90675 RepID=A0ABM0UZP7_CAMSA|nr:PREDICTED: putative E3 ubiquitin-protein ligase UBR7 [Camelina sativa]
MASGGFEDEEAEGTVTINEFIEQMDAEELAADLVLGGDEGDECTYPKGYMKRQAIFSCITCTPDGNAGICTACCLSCHDGHELLELWTKRNFRCDCGNSKFGTLACKLLPSKDVENSENSYNHNFKGLYCTCDLPYPDPNVEEQVEMIQCCLCEDWFHEEHLGFKPSDSVGSQIPRDEEGEPIYEDFICQNCSPLCSFLTLYPEKLWVAAQADSTGCANACSETIESNKTNMDAEAGQLENGTEAEKSVMRKCSEKISESEPGHLDNCSEAEKSVVRKCSEKMNDSEPGQPETSTTEAEKSVVQNGSDKINATEPVAAAGCAIGTNLNSCPDFEKKPLFLSKNWRNILCRCEKCVEMYNERKVSYLLDAEDTIVEYEKKAKEKRTEKLEKQEGEALDLLNNLDHVAKVEILHGIRDFKDELKGLLESGSGGPSKAITAADIEQMFSNLKNKRKRME